MKGFLQKIAATIAVISAVSEKSYIIGNADSCSNEDTDYLCYRIKSLEDKQGRQNYLHRAEFSLQWVNTSTTTWTTMNEDSVITVGQLNLTKNENYDPPESWCQVVDWAQEPQNDDKFDIYLHVYMLEKDDSDNDGDWSRVAIWRSERIFKDFGDGDSQKLDQFYQITPNNMNFNKSKVLDDYSADILVWMQSDNCMVIHNLTINDTKYDTTQQDYKIKINMTSKGENLDYWTESVRQGTTNLARSVDLIGCPMGDELSNVGFSIMNNTDYVQIDGWLPKEEGVEKHKLSDNQLDDTYDGEYEHMYIEYRKCPGDPYAAIAAALQLTFIILLAILAGFAAMVFAGALYAKFNQFDGMDAIRYFNVIWIFIEIYKFVSDLGFMILLGTRDQTIPFFVLVFLVTMGLYVSNVLYLAHLIEVWTNQTAPKHTREWILERKWFLYALTLGLGGMHPALEIANSLLFPIPIFAMHVPYAEIMRVRSERSSTMVLENFPLMVLQFVYFLLIPDLQGADFVFWNAVAASMLSAFISTVYFFTKAEIEEKPIIATHQFTVSTTGGYQDFMQHCHWNMQKAIALSAGVKPVQVMVEDLVVKEGTATASGRIILDIEQAHGDHTHGDKDLEEQMAKQQGMQTPAQAQSNAPAFLKRKFHLSEEPKVAQFDITMMADGQQPVYIRETSISRFFEDMKEKTIALWEKANVTDEKQWGTSQGRPKDMSRVKSMSGVGAGEGDGTTTTGKATDADADDFVEGDAGATGMTTKYKGDMEMVVSTTAPGSPRALPPASPRSLSGGDDAPRPPPSPVSPRPPASPKVRSVSELEGDTSSVTTGSVAKKPPALPKVAPASPKAKAAASPIKKPASPKPASPKPASPKPPPSPKAGRAVSSARAPASPKMAALMSKFSQASEGNPETTSKPASPKPPPVPSIALSSQKST